VQKEKQAIEKMKNETVAIVWWNGEAQGKIRRN
jgi:hypothetical protein